MPYRVVDGVVAYNDDEILWAVNSNHVSIYTGLAASLNAKFLPAAITHVHRITVLCPSIHCSTRYSTTTIECMGLCLLWKTVFFLRLEIRHWPSDLEGKVDPP